MMPRVREVCAEDAGVLAFARRLGFEPDDRQREVLESEAKRGILNCTRQWGKSTVTVVKALHHALEKPGRMVIVASSCGRQSAEWMNKAAGLVWILGIKPKRDGANPISLMLPNGSRIVGLPGKHAAGGVRGFSAVSLMILDEAAWMEDRLYHALTPMLAVSDGDLWMLSTPNGNRGFFYETWAFGEDWHRVSVKAVECPRISTAFLAKLKKDMPEEQFEQEYGCKFLEDGRSVFRRELIERIFTDDFKPLNVPPARW